MHGLAAGQVEVEVGAVAARTDLRSGPRPDEPARPPAPIDADDMQARATGGEHHPLREAGRVVLSPDGIGRQRQEARPQREHGDEQPARQPSGRSTEGPDLLDRLADEVLDELTDARDVRA